ncbi:MAG: CDP-glucose 4,6-dehydratase [Bacilli bacterium]|nr:CDP-glucose 4,6-dehydratase [Bacilli bacterium]
MESLVDILNFYKGKVVLITGHTGFKGSWLSKILIMAGANVVGYSLEAPTNPNLFTLLDLEKEMVSIIGDIRDLSKLSKVFEIYRPEIVFHLAAQPIVKSSYELPVYTYEVNIMGTVNVCENVRKNSFVKSFLNVTTDKVYENEDIVNHPFFEEEKLNGYDPYSNSKSCSDIITNAYYKSFLKEMGIGVSTARAGNVIGGGDFAPFRILPDCARSLEAGETMIIRNPNSIRPYQHVLEPLCCYLEIAKKQYESQDYSGAYNIGPDSCDFVTTKMIVEMFAANFKNEFHYDIKANNGPYEASFLSLSNAKIKRIFGWRPRMDIRKAVDMTAEWYDLFRKKTPVKEITEKQIKEFIEFRT